MSIRIEKIRDRLLDSRLRTAIRPYVFSTLDKTGAIQMHTRVFSTLQLLVLARVGFSPLAVKHLRRILNSPFSSRRWGAANALIQIRNSPLNSWPDEIDSELWRFFADASHNVVWKKKTLAFAFLSSLESVEPYRALTNRYAQSLSGLVPSSADQVFASCNAVRYVDGRQSIAWIDRLNRAFIGENLSPLRLSTRIPTKLSDLSAVPFNAGRIEDGPLVSVIVAVRDGAKWLANAVQSIRNQTWQNLEILIIDDGSNDCTAEVASDIVQSDPRVRLILNRISKGLFAARNIGLDAARGEFVTTHDADDWSHPQKIQRQVEPLIKNDGVEATFSQWVRCSEDLLFHPRETIGKFVHLNPNSLMFRARLVSQIGPWDEVRYSGDREFTERIQKAFGSHSIQLVGKTALSFGLLHTKSLTQTSVSHGLTSYAGYRREYAESFRYWHASVPTGDLRQLSPRSSSDKRRFPVPYPMLPHAVENIGRACNVVISGDFSLRTTSRIGILLSDLSGEIGAEVVVVHSPSAQRPMRPIASPIRQRISTGKITTAVFGDQVRCGLWITVGASKQEITSDLLPTIQSSDHVDLGPRITGARIEDVKKRISGTLQFEATRPNFS